ncbi:MAG: tetratricopeptide repeat protein [Syntrophaceae bacterium]|nr:tetratricopeptide repeat protein [Syntrophaceae bacterium]
MSVPTPLPHLKTWILIGLAALVLLSFQGVFQNGFIHYDDHVYVTDNPHVRGGLSAEGIRWAFTATDAGFWHPLTWLSLMADAQLFRLNPAGYHGTSLLLHLLTTALLFLVLSGLTGRVWPSAFAAALFGVHPLQVEPVAWVAARKDVLCAFFWVAAMGLYGWYALRPGILRYGALAAVFFMGLMAKPMVMTLPFVLLLLDVWPLNRLDFGGGKGFADRGETRRFRPATWKSALLEKVPLLVMAAGVASVTFFAEAKVGALKPLEAFPLSERLGNALVSYVRYLGKTLWPADLSIHYAHPGVWPLWIILGSAVLLAAITLAVLMGFRRRPYLTTGWLWFLGTLIPVIGIVQIGSHAMADRYACLPSIGLFLMVAWGGADCVKAWFPSRARLLSAAAVLLLLPVLAVMDRNQVTRWRDAVSIFRHAARVEPNNALVQNNLGAALTRAEKSAEAIGPLRQALRIRPDYAEAAFNLGAALAEQGDREEALLWYDRALELHPGFAEAYNNKGILAAESGRFSEAAELFQKALTIRPDYREARSNWARVMAERRR